MELLNLPRNSEDRNSMDGGMDGARAFLDLLRSARSMIAALEDSLRASLFKAEVADLTPTHAAVLLNAASMPNQILTISDLEVMVGGSVRQSMKILLDRGYVTTAPDRSDGRITLVSPTARGFDAAARISAALEKGRDAHHALLRRTVEAARLPDDGGLPGRR